MLKKSLLGKTRQKESEIPYVNLVIPRGSRLDIRMILTPIKRLNIAMSRMFSVMLSLSTIG